MLKTISSITNALGALNYKGTWNASTNSPTLADGTGAKGDYYVVSTAGTQTFGGVQLFFGTGDWIAYNGAVWQRVEGGSDGNFANVTLTSTDAGATAAPLLDLYRDSATPAASDTLGEIEFNGEDSAGNKQAYGLIHASILSPTSTAEQGQLHFETATAGALTEKMIIGTNNLVINEIGAVFNVRIEGDTDANLFYTDATNSRVGVGTLAPQTKFEVSQTNAKSATGVWQTQIFDSTTQGTGVGGGISLGGYKTAQTSAEIFAGIDAYKENSTGGNAAGALRFHTQPSGGTGLVEAVRIGSTGNVTVSTGNLIIGTSGKGIDFSATDGTGTSELLADYEEGTWTPSDTSGAGLTLTITGTSIYTKIGRQVIATADITYPATVDATLTLVGGLPFTTAAAPSGAGSIGYTDYGTWITPAPGGGVTAFRFVGATTFLTNAQLSGKRVQVTIIYTV